MRFTFFLLLLSFVSCGTSAMVQEPGVPFPDFALSSHDGAIITKSDLMGSPSVIWFYPKASSPG